MMQSDYLLNEFQRKIKQVKNNISTDETQIGTDINTNSRIRRLNQQLQKIEKETSDVLDGLKHHIIPASYKDKKNTMLGYCIGLDLGYLSLRRHIIDLQGFVLLAHDWIDKLTTFIGNKKCLEVMSGTGSLSYMLKQKEVSIIPTDNFSWSKSTTSLPMSERWLNIENIDCVSAIRKYGSKVDYIIMSWPETNGVATSCLNAMREVNPNCKMLYFGEPEGGCTADDDFFCNAIFLKDKNIDEINNLYPTWCNIHDRLYLIK